MQPGKVVRKELVFTVVVSKSDLSSAVTGHRIIVQEFRTPVIFPVTTGEA
jgi:hypothetical protein